MLPGAVFAAMKACREILAKSAIGARRRRPSVSLSFLPLTMGGNQPGRPEPHAERQVGAVHDRAGGDRRLLAAAFAAEGEGRAARQTPRLPPAATRAGEALRPARARQMLAARGVVGKASLELMKRAGISGHERALRGVCS